MIAKNTLDLCETFTNYVILLNISYMLFSKSKLTEIENEEEKFQYLKSWFNINQPVSNNSW